MPKVFSEQIRWIVPEQFNVDEFYRLEDNSNPDDNVMFYTISSYTGIKGTPVDSYGIQAESMTFRMAKEIEVNYDYTFSVPLPLAPCNS